MLCAFRRSDELNAAHCLFTVLRSGVLCRPKFRKDPLLWKNIGAITRRHADKYKESTVFSLTDANDATTATQLGSFMDAEQSHWSEEGSGFMDDWEQAVTEDGQPYWYVRPG